MTDAVKLQQTDAASREATLPAKGFLFSTAHYAEQSLQSVKDLRTGRKSGLTCHEKCQTLLGIKSESKAMNALCSLARNPTSLQHFFFLRTQSKMSDRLWRFEQCSVHPIALAMVPTPLHQDKGVYIDCWSVHGSSFN